jgi:hypothetical protein
VTAVATGASYATLAKLKQRMGIPDAKTDKDAELTDRLASASEDVNRWCHRQFGQDTVATARTFKPGLFGVDTHDFYTTTGLAVVPYLGPTAGTPWDVSMLQLEPLDGIVDMVPGWPFNRICSGYDGHPMLASLFYVASTVKVTAKWGWADVPKNVELATLLLASMDMRSKDTPFGVAAFGDYAVRIRSNPMAQEKLEPYIYRGTASSTLMVAT